MDGLPDITRINNISRLQEIKTLAKLSLINCQLNETDLEDISKNNNLTDLRLNNNNISNIDKIVNLKSLTSLVIVNNLNVEDYSKINELHLLQSLVLSNDNLSNINFFNNLTNLTYADFSENNISDITALKNSKKLATLYLQNNDISDITVLESLKYLETVKLNNNKIEDFSVILKNPNIGLNSDSSQSKISEQEITLEALPGSTIKLPKIVKQANELFKLTKSIDTINCTVSEDFTECTIDEGVQNARIKISDGTLEKTTIIINVTDSPTSQEVYQSSTADSTENAINKLEINKFTYIYFGIIIVLIIGIIIIILKIIRLRKYKR